MRNALQLFINGRTHRVPAEHALTTLSDYLRRVRGLVGTKVVCAEGDCGSCAVLVGRPHAGAMRYRALTSCIVRMVQLDATHVVTVEGLRRDESLTVIQEQMVQCHGTQCGFCTPGFVVSLHELLDAQEAVDATQVRRHLTGNLCRCTGYDAIVRAALAVDPAEVTPLDELYPPKPLAAELSTWAEQPVDLAGDGRRLFKPATLEQALDFLAEEAEAGRDPTLLAGGTDLGVEQNKGRRTLPRALVLTGLAELSPTQVTADDITLGGGAPLTDLEDASAEHLPELARLLGWFGSPLIRHAGTVAGNLCTASPIGDLPPALYVLGAQVTLASAAGTRTLSVEEFQTGYRTTQRRPDELLTQLRIPRPRHGETLKLYKISRRKDLDISGFSAAFWLDHDGETVADARVAFGGVGPRVLRIIASSTSPSGRARPAAAENMERSVFLRGKRRPPR